MLLIWAPLAHAADSRSTCKLSTPKLQEEIQQLGARAVLKNLSQSRDWGGFLTCIATGESNWIQVAISLKPESDGSVGEDLANAVGEALDEHPEIVLQFAFPTFYLEQICSTPDSYDSRFDSYQAAFLEIEKREDALTEVRDPLLEERAKICRAHLEDAKKLIAQWPKT